MPSDEPVMVTGSSRTSTLVGMTCGPPPGMLNVIVLPQHALATAARSVPALASPAALVTTGSVVHACTMCESGALVLGSVMLSPWYSAVIWRKPAMVGVRVHWPSAMGGTSLGTTVPLHVSLPPLIVRTTLPEPDGPPDAVTTVKATVNGCVRSVGDGMMLVPTS